MSPVLEEGLRQLMRRDNDVLNLTVLENKLVGRKFYARNVCGPPRAKLKPVYRRRLSSYSGMLALLVYRALDFRGNGRYMFPCARVYSRFRDEIQSCLCLLDFTVKLKTNFYIRILIFLLFQLNNKINEGGIFLWNYFRVIKITC